MTHKRVCPLKKCWCTLGLPSTLGQRTWVCPSRLALTLPRTTIEKTKTGDVIVNFLFIFGAEGVGTDSLLFVYSQKVPWTEIEIERRNHNSNECLPYQGPTQNLPLFAHFCAN